MLKKQLKGRSVIKPTKKRKAARKLTEAEAIEIIRLRRMGIELDAVAEQFNVTKGAVCHITTGRTWTYLDRSGEGNNQLTENRSDKPPMPIEEDVPEKACPKCKKPMTIKNISNACHTVFILWTCSGRKCKFEHLEKRRTPAGSQNAHVV